MVYLRRLGSHFDPIYIKPANLSRAVSLFGSGAIDIPIIEQASPQLPPRRQQDRRCGVERRCRQLPVLLDTRSPHARRKQSHRRRHDHRDLQSGVGIDVYA